MIIDATKRFNRKRAGKNIPVPAESDFCYVVSLSDRYDNTFPNSAEETSVEIKSVHEKQEGDSQILRDTFGSLVFRSRDITSAFYKRIIRKQWWDKPHFNDLVTNDSSRLMSALMGMAYDPPKPEQLVRFLCEASRKFNGHGLITGNDYDMAPILIDAIIEVNRARWDLRMQQAWKQVLQPDIIFNTARFDKHDQA